MVTEPGRVLSREQVETMMGREQSVGPRFGTSAEQVALARSHEQLREQVETLRRDLENCDHAYRGLAEPGIR